jgi:formylglycine-generating enzyme required for sulfatase activity
MTDFAQSLEAWRRGERTVRDLTTEAGTLVGRDGIDPTVLLGTLHASHQRDPLPQEVYSTLEHSLQGWLKDSTVMQGRPRGNQHTRPFGKPDESRTVIVNPEGDEELFRALASDEPGAAALIDVGHILQDRFELVELIGEGGMSSVYKATDLRKVEARADDPYVAVKVLTIPFRHYSRSLALLQREAQKIQSLAHPNIVRVFDCDRDGQIVFMTLEYLAGRSLKQALLAPGFNGMAPTQAVRIIEAVGNALAFAHRNGIVHGDLKPGNIIITDKGEIKVIDFGIARAVTEAEDTGQTADAPDLSKFTALTPPYASPEMLEHKPADRRDDIYAFACIVCEILTGKHPFDCKPATVARSNGIKLVRDEKISRQQYKAITRGLEFDRAARTPTVENFLRDFGIEPAKPPRNRWAIAAVGVLLVLLGLYVARDYLSPATRSSSAAQQTSAAPLQVGEVFRDCPTCPLMTVLPAGQFEQGSAVQDSYAQPAEQPQHIVTIANHFGMSVNEVTLGEFREFARDTNRAATGCEIYDGTWHRQAQRSWNDTGFTQTTTHPATCVTWNDATGYVRWLATKTRHAYRLASASEWEYAARAGSAESQPWPANAAAACAQANVADGTAAAQFPGWDVQACSDGYVYTAPVGSFQTNAFGLHDMYGNVFEWVQDCWHEDYAGAPEDGSAWAGGDCNLREMRGGSWFTTPSYVRPAYRNRFAADYASSSIGFRIVRDLHE